MATSAVFAGCSTDAPPSEYEVFPSISDVEFSIPPYEPGRCRYDYRAQISLLDAASGVPRWTTDVPWTANFGVAVAGEVGVVMTAEPGVIAVNLADGRPLWQRSFGGRSARRAEASVLGDAVTTSEGTDLVSFDASDGRVDWRVPIASDNPKFAGDGDLIVAVEHDGATTAVERTSGEVVWKVAATASDGNASQRPIFSDAIVITETGTGGVRGIDRTRGAVRWEVELEDDRIVSRLIGTTDALALFSERNDPGSTGGAVSRETITIVARDLESGDVVWIADLTKNEVHEIALVGDLVVSSAPGAVAIDAQTGEAVWTPPGRPTAAIGDEQSVYLVDVDRLIAVDRTTGRTRWDVQLPGWIGELIATSGAIFAGYGKSGLASEISSAEGGGVVAIDPTDGSTIWDTPRRDLVDAKPVLTDRGLVVVSSDPWVFCD